MLNKKTLEAQVAFEIQSILGEGPVWNPFNNKLYWVDIEKKEVHELNLASRAHRCWTGDARTGCVVPVSEKVLLVGQQGKISLLDLESGSYRKLISLEAENKNIRCNDGKGDSAGRLWVGTMDVDCKPGHGSLFNIDSQLTSHNVLSDLTISNGLGWSPDDKYMYFIDSPERALTIFEYDGTTSIKKIKQISLAENANEFPDGLCVDAEGMVWIAFWGGQRVIRLNPNTEQKIMEIKMPAINVTSCTFGGPKLDTLFITTARQGLTESELRQYPLSGSIFYCTPGTNGVNANPFRMASAQ